MNEYSSALETIDYSEKLNLNIPQREFRDIRPLYSCKDVLFTFSKCSDFKPGVFSHQHWKAVIFTGDPGNGKYEMADAYASAFFKQQDKNSCDFLRIHGSDIDAQEEEVSICLVKKVCLAKQEGRLLLILLEDPEFCRHWERACFYFSELLLRKDVHMVVVANESEPLVSVCRGFCRHFHMACPSKTQRQAFLEELFKDHSWCGEWTADDYKKCIDRLEGFTWLELQQLVEEVKITWHYNKRKRDRGAKEDVIETLPFIETRIDDILCTKPNPPQQALPPIYYGAFPMQQPTESNSPSVTVKDEATIMGEEKDKLLQKQNELKKEAEFHKHPEKMAPPELYDSLVEI